MNEKYKPINIEKDIEQLVKQYFKRLNFVMISALATRFATEIRLSHLKSS